MNESFAYIDDHFHIFPMVTAIWMFNEKLYDEKPFLNWIIINSNFQKMF